MTAKPDAAREAFYAALLDDDPETLYERAPCGYVSTTPDGTILKVNQTFETWTGWPRSELVGRHTFAELLSPGGRMYHETHLAPMLLMQGRVREIALDITAADGRRLPVLANAVMEKTPGGHPVVVRIALFDATERREYERELLRAKRRAEESEARAVALARTLQQSLVPPVVPDIAGLEVAGAYRPAGDGEEVGGDFYDIFQIGADDWAVALGDVCGKGVDAALLTSLVRHSLRAITVREPDPAAVLHELNAVLLHEESERFCTVVLLRVRRRDGGWEIRMASGGHPQPLLRQAAGATAAVAVSGTVVGVLDDAEFVTTPLLLEPGQTLVLYTDGVTEGRADGWLYGEARLAEVIAGHVSPATELPAVVLADALAYQGQWPRDDIAVVALHVPESDRRR